MPWTVKTLNKQPGRENARQLADLAIVAASRPPGEGWTEATPPAAIGPLAAAWRSTGACRVPQRQHAVEAEPVDSLGHTGLLDLPCNRGQTKRIKRGRSRRAQKCQVAESRRKLVVTNRQIGLRRKARRLG